jgi:hypothetical protein
VTEHPTAVAKLTDIVLAAKGDHITSGARSDPIDHAPEGNPRRDPKQPQQSEAIFLNENCRIENGQPGGQINVLRVLSMD